MGRIVYKNKNSDGSISTKHSSSSGVSSSFGGSSSSGGSSSRTTSGSSASRSTSNSSSGSYSAGDKYVGGTTFRRSDGSTYNVGGSFTSPSGRISDIDSSGNVTTTGSRDKNQVGNTYYNNGNGNYTSSGNLTSQNEYLSKMQSAANAAAEAQRAKTNQAVSALESNRSTIERNAEEAARQAYISKMLTQKNLAQQLKATGYSGGLSDTAVLRMNTNYENSRDNIMKQKVDALNDLNSQVAQAKASGKISAAQAESEWQQKLADLQYNLQKEAAAQQMQQQMKTTAGTSTSGNTQRYTISQLQNLYDNGMIDADQFYEYSGLERPKTNSLSNQNNTQTVSDTITNTVGTGWIAVPGIGRITKNELANYISSGQVVAVRNADGSISYRVV